MVVKLSSLFAFLLICSSQATAEFSYKLWSDEGGFPCASQYAVMLEGVTFFEESSDTLYQDYTITIDSDGDSHPEKEITGTARLQAPTTYGNVSYCADHESYLTGPARAYDYEIELKNGNTFKFVSAYCLGGGNNKDRRLIAFAGEVYCLKREELSPCELNPEIDSCTGGPTGGGE